MRQRTKAAEMETNKEAPYRAGEGNRTPVFSLGS